MRRRAVAGADRSGPSLPIRRTGTRGRKARGGVAVIGGRRWAVDPGGPARTVFGRPVPVFLIALEKSISALAAMGGAVLALLLHMHRSTDPLQFLLPGEVSETPRDIMVRWLYAHMPHIGPGIILLAVFGLTFWAVLLAAEAVGVWRGLAWGEFLVIVETASFLPAELYDIVRRPHPTGFITLTVNLLILWYVGVLYRRRLRLRLSGAAGATAMFGSTVVVPDARRVPRVGRWEDSPGAEAATYLAEAAPTAARTDDQPGSGAAASEDGVSARLRARG